MVMSCLSLTSTKQTATPMQNPKPRTAKNARWKRSALFSLAGLALLIAPASAATGADNFDVGAFAVIAAVGVLLSAMVIEVWRVTLSGPLPVRNRATQDWTPKKNR